MSAPRLDVTFVPQLHLPVSASCAQVWVRQRQAVPLLSVLSIAAAPQVVLNEMLHTLQHHEGYPNCSWHVADCQQVDGARALDLPAYETQLLNVEVQRFAPSTPCAVMLQALAEAAQGEYLLFLSPRWLPQLYAFYQLLLRLKMQPQVGAVGGVWQQDDQQILHAGVVWAQGQALVLDHSLLRDAFPLLIRHVPAVSGECLLLRRAAFLAQGGFGAAWAQPLSQHALGVAWCGRVVAPSQQHVVLAAGARFTSPQAAVASPPAVLQTASDGAALAAMLTSKALQPPEHSATRYSSEPHYQQRPMHVTVVSCINDPAQYATHVLGSLLNNYTHSDVEVQPIMNTPRRYSAAAALNLGIARSQANLVVLCHQDVIFFKTWLETLYVRLQALVHQPWCIVGTAGVREDGIALGNVQRLDGSFEWYTLYKQSIAEVQTVDEHCMVYNKHSGILFDATTFDGFHFYGPDICLTARQQKRKNYAMYNPLVHNGSGGSLRSGQAEYARLLSCLAHKWGAHFPAIRTPTCCIQHGRATSYLTFDA